MAYSGAFIGDLRDEAQSYYSAYLYHKPLKCFLMLRSEGWTQQNVFCVVKNLEGFSTVSLLKRFHKSLVQLDKHLYST